MTLQIQSIFTPTPKLITHNKTTQIKSRLHPSNPTPKTRFYNPNLHSGISSNMWWANLKASIGQRFNFEGILSSAKVIAKDHELALPHLTVPDIRWVNWLELKKRGFNGVIFDKDNTLTAPYALTLWPPLKPSLERCKAVFGEDNVAVFSNTAGLFEFDPDGSRARELEREIGVRVIRHRVKKPAGSGEEIEKHFGFESKTMVMVGDRVFTDIVYGNRNGFVTVLTRPLSLKEESFVVRQVRRFEVGIVSRWCKKGLKPIDHGLLSDGYVTGLVSEPLGAELR